jgi:hypothetical protein
MAAYLNSYLSNQAALILSQELPGVKRGHLPGALRAKRGADYREISRYQEKGPVH